MADNALSKNNSLQKMSLGEKVSFGVGPIGKSMTSGLVYGSFFSLYLMEELGISPAFLAVMFFAARIWDGVNDLLMGAIIDSTRSKYGKFRPWIVIGAVSNAAVSILMYWSPGFKGVALYIYITLLYLLFDATFTMIDVGYWALVPAMTLDKKERDQVSVIPRVTGAVGGLVSSFTLNIVDALGGRGVNQGFLRFSFIAAAFYILTSVLCAAKTKERVTLPRPEGEKFSLIRAAKVLLANDQALVVVGIMIFFNVAYAVTTGMALFYFTYVLEMDSFFGTFSIIIGAAQGVGLIGFPFIAKIVNRNKLYLTAYAFPCLGYAMLTVFSFLAPKNIPLFCIGACVATLCYGSLGIMQNIMLADAVDYGEWKYGDRNEGIIFSMLTFLSKIANGISQFIVFAGFAIVNFDSSAEVSATPEVITMIKIVLFLVPPIFLAGAFILHKAKFKLKPEFTEQITNELIERRTEN